MVETVFAEDINYWQTSRTSPAAWLEKSARLVTLAGGQVLMHAVGNDPFTNRESYALIFGFEGDRFKVVWSALPLKKSTENKELAAKRQAATLLYHEVKSRCMIAKVKGFRQAFFAHFMLPDGRVASEVSSSELMELDTSFLNVLQIEDGD